MSFRVLVVAIAAILALAYMVGIRGLLDDGQSSYGRAVPECLELHKLSYCQEWGKDWANPTLNGRQCELLGDSKGNRWLECELEGGN